MRTLEARARAVNERGKVTKTANRKAKDGSHADQHEAAVAIATSLEEAFGAEVRVRPVGGGYRAELSFAGVEEALALARRLRRATGD